MPNVRLKVSDVMTSDPLTIASRATVGEAYASMTDHRFHHLPVVDDGQLVGMISMTDIGHAGAARLEVSSRAIADLMTQRPHAIAPEDPIAHAAAQMALHKIHCLLVVSGTRLIGIVTTYDLLDAFLQTNGD